MLKTLQQRSVPFTEMTQLELRFLPVDGLMKSEGVALPVRINLQQS